MIDIDDIKKRHLDPERNRGRTYYEGHIEVDLAALIAEVERLRDERAAVVAWLREQALQSHPDAAGWFALHHVSVMIERGEHRREGER